MRTKLIDDQILDALSDSKISEEQPEAVRQVVVLGAGMDTRAWRMDLPEGIQCIRGAITFTVVISEPMQELLYATTRAEQRKHSLHASLLDRVQMIVQFCRPVSLTCNFSSLIQQCIHLILVEDMCVIHGMHVRYQCCQLGCAANRETPHVKCCFWLR